VAVGGQPTKLVRDGEVEFYEALPDEEPSAVAEWFVPEPPRGADRPRAGDQQDEVPTKAIDAAVFGAISSWELPTTGTAGSPSVSDPRDVISLGALTPIFARLRSLRLQSTAARSSVRRMRRRMSR
jgi:hypothetical protein